MTYTNDMFRSLFQSSFNLNDWQKLLLDFFDADHLRREPEHLDDDTDEYQGYYLGSMTTSDSYELGFFYYEMRGAIDHRRVGLRQLLKPYLSIGVDAALVVFNDGRHWRLSFICDIKGESNCSKAFYLCVWRRIQLL